MFKNALVSVADKTGLIEFIKPLAEKGMRVVSTGGTAKHLKEAGIKVASVSEQTDFPEVMDGRVKTLHPRIHMALLARNYVDEDMKTLEQHELAGFDLVVGNLYAFEEALNKGVDDQQLQEFIDIGGPSFLRAAAKNYSRITTVCHPSDYSAVLAKAQSRESNLDDRKSLASKVFSHVSTYDSMIAGALANKDSVDKAFGGKLVQTLRYGENPHQSAGWFRSLGKKGLQDAEVIQGKPLSYNNILDLDAAVSTLIDLSSTTKFAEIINEKENLCTAVAVKHNNPCGVARSQNLIDAVTGSLEADPVSVFGAIVAIDTEIDEASAKKLSGLFLECVIAPAYTETALKVFSKKKNLRILQAPEMMNWQPSFSFRSVLGGFLTQEVDKTSPTFSENWQIIGESPEGNIRNDLLFCWKVCAHLKSNAIALASNLQTLGLGMGQVNRVDAVEQAISRAKKFHPNKGPVVLASDAFFPFADSVEIAAKAGIKWIIQPGGSIKDDEVVAAAKELGVNLVMTGSRHFMH